MLRKEGFIKNIVRLAIIHLLQRRSKWVACLALLMTFWVMMYVARMAEAIGEDKYSDHLINSLAGLMGANNTETLRHIRKEVLIPPSRRSYNLSNHVTQHILEEESERFYKKYLRLFFGFKRNGFFVEAGALDGESMSNTLWLEKHLEWTGLLIEPDPSSFKLLRQKNRKAWSANVCLSSGLFPKKELLSTRDIISSKNKHNSPRLKAIGFIVEEESDKWANNLFFSYYTSQCFPLSFLLMALNVTRVDLLSLDVENIEEDIIRNFEFNKFGVQVIFLEWKKHNKLIWLRSFLEEMGFSYVDNIYGDIVFVKNRSEYEFILNIRYPLKKMNIWHPDQVAPEKPSRKVVK